MASGKLSARQKMINMMYLVLTAILALNVSSEILEAFETIRSSLETTVGATSQQNNILAEGIVNAIEKEEKNANDKHSHLKPLIAGVTKETRELVQYLDGISDELEVFGKKDPLTGELTRKDEVNENYAYWMGGNDLANERRGKGKALELHNRLDGFVAWANKVTEEGQFSGAEKFQALVIDPADDPEITDPEAKQKPWEYFTFQGKPVIADMAMVEKFKMDVQAVESKLLSYIKDEIKDYAFTVDSIFAFEAPSSEYVTAGMKYDTRLLVGVSSSSIKPEFLGSGITTDASGSTATMSMTANGSVIPDGAMEGIQRYRAMIKVPKADGSMMELPLEGQFKVRKPEVQVRSKALQLLYKDCGNTVIVDVPSLGELYNPDFSNSKGGRVIRNPNNRKEITISPNQRQFKLDVATKTNGQNIKLDRLTYKVIKPPKPQIVLISASGQEYNGMAAINRRQSVKVMLKPDPEFAGTLPRDARYKAKKIKLMAQDGIQAPRVIQEKSGSNIQRGVSFSLNQGSMRSLPPGSKIYFEVEEVSRVNFQNKNISENISRYGLVIPAVIR